MKVSNSLVISVNLKQNRKFILSSILNPNMKVLNSIISIHSKESYENAVDGSCNCFNENKGKI